MVLIAVGSAKEPDRQAGLIEQHPWALDLAAAQLPAFPCEIGAKHLRLGRGGPMQAVGGFELRQPAAHAGEGADHVAGHCIVAMAVARAIPDERILRLHVCCPRRQENLAGHGCLFDITPGRCFRDGRAVTHRPAHQGSAVFHALVDHEDFAIGHHGDGGVGDAQGIERRSAARRIGRDVDNRLIEARPWAGGVVGPSHTDAVVVAVDLVGAIAEIADVIEIVDAILADAVGVVGHVAIPVFLAGSGIDAAGGQRHVDMGERPAGTVGDGIGDFRPDRPAGRKAVRVVLGPT